MTKKPLDLLEPAELSFHPLTQDRWDDLEELFGPRGATGGCWCMWWRQTASERQTMKGEENRRAFKWIVDHGETPGVLAYHQGKAVGWCAVAPREAYPALERSRNMKRVDDLPVWSITCFFVKRDYRRRGVMDGLIRAAVDYATQQGATIVEAYPNVPQKEDVPDVFIFTGLLQAFLEAGFVEAARRSPRQPVVRWMKPPAHTGRSG